MDPRFKALAKPFPADAYKEVRMGPRSFTAIDAYHIVERLTEVFGMCGTGWGVNVDEWVRYGDSVAALGFLWYADAEKAPFDPKYVRAVGDGVVMKNGNVAEAHKKAFTNLMSKAASYIGVGLSVYQGKGIDDPYLDRAADASAGNAKLPPVAGKTITAKQAADLWQAAKANNVTAEELKAYLAKEPCCVDSIKSILQVHLPLVTAWVQGESPFDVGKEQA